MRIAGGAILPLAILITWWAVSAAQLVSPRLLPTPLDVVAAGVDLAGRGLLLDDLAISIQRVLTGAVAGALAGLLLGTLVGRSRTARILLTPTIAAIRAVPTMAWLPVLLLYAGLEEAPKVALIAIGAAFPVFAAASGRTGLITGFRLALAQSWVFLVAAELIQATAGVGFLLSDASATGRADRLLVGVLLIVALARISDALMAWLERLMRRRASSA
jgi:sulfonate transport system permease protein